MRKFFLILCSTAILGCVLSLTAMSGSQSHSLYASLS